MPNSKIYSLSGTYTESLPSPYELQQDLPMSRDQIDFVESSRCQIKKILNGEDSRILLVVGPCSIHNIAAAKEYAMKLHDLSLSVSDTFLLVMRTYFEKSRTIVGWKGLLYDPFLDGSYNIASGLKQSRQLLLDLATLKIPTATEFLDPLIPNYLGNLISWGCIGARTSNSQIHRQMASSLPIPIGFKNNTDGNIDVALEGVLSAASPHSFVGINDAGQTATVHTRGNSCCHLVLRGADHRTNYDVESIEKVLKKLKDALLPLRVVIDSSHGNSSRQHERQPAVFQSILEQILEGNTAIRGTILESNLVGGKQQLSSDADRAISVTDACLDWETTEMLIKNAYQQIKHRKTAEFHDLPTQELVLK